MTVASTDRKTQSLANGSVKVFSFSWPVLDEDHIEVHFRDLDGVEEEQLTGFTKFINANGIGGSITFTIAPTADYYVIIVRQVPETQQTDYVENADLRAATLENDFDKLIMVDQQQTEILQRALKVPISDTGTSVEIPNETERAGKFLFFNATTGNPQAVIVGATIIPYTTYIATLLDDTSAAIARETLGLVISTDVQSYSATLDYLAAYSPVTNEIMVWDSATTISGAPTDVYGRGLLALTSAAGVRQHINAGGTGVDNVWTETQLYDDGSLTIQWNGWATWDLGTNQNAYLLLTENTTMSGINIPTDTGYYTLMIEQDGTGNFTLTFPSSFKFVDGDVPVVTTTASGVDLLGGYARNGNVYCTIAQNFS